MEKKIGKQIYCDTCNCYIPSVSLMSTHENGRKHQNILKKKKQKERSIQNSVYIKGFKKDSNIEYELKTYFSEYGPIKDIYVDKEKSNYALVEFDSSSAVKRLLQEEKKHTLQDHHIIVKQRKFVNESTKLTKELDNGGDKNAEHQDVLDLTSDTSLDVALANCTDVSDQMMVFVDILQLKAEDLKLRLTLCELLQSIFNEVFTDCKVLPFGSTVTKLGSRGCDLDLTLITKELDSFQCKQKFTTAGKRDTNASISNVSDVSNISLSSDKDVVEVSEILRRFAPGCKNVFPVKSAHCPVIKFEHKDSGLHCDLSINNRLAVENSELLRLYCEADYRLKPLAFTIRLWAKARKISGTSACQLTQYALVLMLIHYLQHCDPPVLPCLQDIHSGECERQDDCLINGWSCYFYRDVSNLDKSENSLCLLDLLVDFFQYYSTFDYKTQVISVKTRNPLTREAHVLNLMDDAIDHLFKEGPVCIVDPFEVTHNVAQNTSIAGLELIRTEMQNALALLVAQLKDGNELPDHKIEETTTSSVSSLGKPFNSLFDLRKLFEAKKDFTSGKKHKNKPKVKYIFDIRNAESRNAGKMCSYCASKVMEVIQDELKMQCKIMYHYINRVDCNKDQNSSSKPIANTKQLSPNMEHDVVQTKEPDAKFIDHCVKTNNKNMTRIADDIGARTQSSSPGCGRKRAAPQTIEDEPDIPSKHQRCESTTVDQGTSESRLDCQQSRVDDLDCIEIHATAWANTWTNRRQQRRILNVLREDIGKNGVQDSNLDACHIGGSAPLENKSIQSTFSTSNVLYSPAPSCSAQSDTNTHNISCNSSNLLKTNTANGSENEEKSQGRGPIIVTDIKVAALANSTGLPKCRIIVKVKEARTLDLFHSFFAFFKKSVLATIRNKET